MVAKAAVEDHAAGGRKRAYCLLDGDGLFEGKQCAGLVESSHALAVAHNHERDSIELPRGLQFPKKLRAAVQITIDDEGVNFGAGKLLHGSPGFAFDRNIHVKTAKDA